MKLTFIEVIIHEKTITNNRGIFKHKKKIFRMMEKE